VEARALKREKRGFKSLDEQFGKIVRTEASIVHLRIREIDRDIQTILGLPEKPVQSYWNLRKKRRELESKLKTKGF
jgi:hypothetical protein